MHKDRVRNDLVINAELNGIIANTFIEIEALKSDAARSIRFVGHELADLLGAPERRDEIVTRIRLMIMAETRATAGKSTITLNIKDMEKFREAVGAMGEKLRELEKSGATAATAAAPFRDSMRALEETEKERIKREWIERAAITRSTGDEHVYVTEHERHHMEGLSEIVKRYGASRVPAVQTVFKAVLTRFKNLRYTGDLSRITYLAPAFLEYSHAIVQHNDIERVMLLAMFETENDNSYSSEFPNVTIVSLDGRVERAILTYPAGGKHPISHTHESVSEIDSVV